MLPFRLLFVLLAMSRFTHQQQYSCRARAPCGCSMKSAILAKIVGGEPVRERSWGWIVSLSFYFNHKHFCGGSILSNTWVLTAAHCVFKLDASLILVNAGSNKLNESTQQRRVANIFSHPYYDHDTFDNDIALLQLSSPLDMSDIDVAKICLPLGTVSSSTDTMIYMDEYPPVGSTLVAVGWGSQAEKVKLMTEELQQVTLKAVAYESSTCEQWISSRAMQFCAGVEKGGKDTCQGDSGGPLMKFTSNRQWVVAGVTSFGKGCGRAEHSGVYTRVTFYTDWINATINVEDERTDSALHAHDLLLEDETMDDVLLKQLGSNTCSRCYSFSLLYIVTMIGLSLCFV